MSLVINNHTWLEISNLIIENYSTNYLKAFENEVETQIFIFSTDSIKSIINDWMNSRDNYNRQDFESSSKYKDVGNLKYKSNKFYEAAYYYTKALFRAPKEGNLSAICHSNRAAALIVMGYFEEAFDDCICALELGYQNLMKIYYRQVTCAIGMKDALKLKESIRNLNVQVTKNNKGLLLQKDLERFKNELNELENSWVDNNNIEVTEKPYMEFKKQRVMSSSDKGRYVIADDPIIKDDEIMSEEAFGFVTTYSNIGSTKILESNCMNCGKEHIIPFPCYACLQAFYCSIDCREKQNLVHSFECKAMLKKILDEIGIGYLAFKTLLIGFPELKKYCNEVLDQNSTINQIWDSVNCYRSKNATSYSNVLNLITNFEKSTMSVEDYLRYSLTGTMLTEYLSKNTNFFCHDVEQKSFNTSNSRNWQIVVAALITRHIGQMISNAHLIIKFNINVNCCDEHFFGIWKKKNHLNPGNLHYFKEIKPVFTAIYPRVSLYNHSCEPNFRNRFNKINLSVIANNNLNIGDEILNSYGIDCRKTPKNVRLKQLMEQYHFICDCENCKTVDHKFKKTRLLKCCNANCNYEFYPTEIPNGTEIWNDEVVHDNNLRINCPTCKTRWKFDWYKLFKIEIEDIKSKQSLKYERFNQYKQSLTFEKFKTIYELYQIGNKFLNEFHILKLQMALDITEIIILMLTGELNLKSNWLGLLMPVSADMMKFAENYYGLYNLQYIVYGIYSLDLIATLKFHSLKAEIDYDLKKIKKSFEILPDRTKLIFDNYFNDYVS